MTGIEEFATAAGGEILGSAATETMESAAGVAGGFAELEGVCPAEAIKAAQDGLSAVFPDAFDQIQKWVRMSIAHQVAGALSDDNEALSLLSRAAVYACGALVESPQTLEKYAKEFDSMTVGGELKKSVEKLSKCDGIGEITAKAMARSALTEIGKENEASSIANGVFNSLSRVFQAPRLAEMQIKKPEKLSEFNNASDLNREIAGLSGMKISDAVDIESVWKQFERFSSRIDRGKLSPRGAELYDAWKNQIDMNFLQECADDVSKTFGLPRLPVWRAENNFYHWTGEDRINVIDDVYGGDPELLKQFIEKTASVHPEIPPLIKAKVMGRLLFAHESSHLMFSQCPLKFPRAVEEMACDIIIRSYAIESGIVPGDVVHDLWKAFCETYNNPQNESNIRIFDEDGTWLYPSTDERILIPERTLGGFVGTFRDFAPQNFLPGSKDFDIARVGLFAANCMNAKLDFNPELGKFELKDGASKTGVSFRGHNSPGPKIGETADSPLISQKTLDDLKAWTTKTFSAAIKNKALMMSLVYYLRQFCGSLRV